MFIFSCIILAYFICMGRIYIPRCCKKITESLKYGVVHNWKERYNNYVNRYELSKSGLKQIKKQLLKSIDTTEQTWFSMSESILTMNIEDFNANTISDLLMNYKNVREWGSSNLGDVLYILKTTPLKTTRAYTRNLRCYHILLDEFIYYLYKNLNTDEIKSRFGNDYIFLKMLIFYYGISEGESNYERQSNLNISESESESESDVSEELS